MKNVKVNILLALFAIVGLSLSCTTDSDSGGGSDNNKHQRVVSKIVCEYMNEDWVDEYAFKYNSEGRITRITHAYTDLEDSYEEELCHYERYKYGSGNELVIEWEDDGYEADVYEATLNNNGYLSTVYYENDDYTDEWSYTYDTKGRLISVLNEYGSDEDCWTKFVYKWSGGNVVEITSEDDEGDLATRYISYNSKSMDMVNIDLNAALGGFVGGLYIDVCDNGYYGDGLCGQKSKNLMTGWVHEDDSEEYQETYEEIIKWSYDEDGYPVGAVVAEDGEEYCRVSIEYKK